MSYIHIYEIHGCLNGMEKEGLMTKHAFYNVNRNVYKFNENEIIP